MTDLRYGTGFIPDRLPDVVGRAASALRRREVLAGIDSLPDEYEIAAPRFAGQGSTNSCVGFGVVQALHLYRAARGLDDPYHSPFHVYAWTRRMQNPFRRTLVDEGCSPRVMQRAVRKHGIGYAADWGPSVDGFSVNSLPATLANINAQRWSLDIPTIWDTGDIIAHRIGDSVCKKYPAMIGLPVDRRFQRVIQPPVIGPPTGPIIGNHFMAVLGTRLRADGTRDTKVAQSWRRDWAEQATAWLSSAYVAMAIWVGYLRNVTRPA